MSDRELLKSQANQIFGQIKDSGLSPAEFEWRKNESDWDTWLKIPVLVHKSSSYYLTFDVHDDSYYSEFSPGRETWVEVELTNNWKNQTELVREWLKYLRREVEAPDLWEAISQETKLMEASSVDNNAPFNNEELKQIAAGLDEIKQYIISTNEFSLEQEKFIENRIQYLKEASERMGRKDWVILAVGVLTNIIVGVSLSPNAARELFRLAGQVLHQIISGPHLLL